MNTKIITLADIAKHYKYIQYWSSDSGSRVYCRSKYGVVNIEWKTTGESRTTFHPDGNYRLVDEQQFAKALASFNKTVSRTLKQNPKLSYYYGLAKAAKKLCIKTYNEKGLSDILQWLIGIQLNAKNKLTKEQLIKLAGLE